MTSAAALLVVLFVLTATNGFEHEPIRTETEKKKQNSIDSNDASDVVSANSVKIEVGESVASAASNSQTHESNREQSQSSQPQRATTNRVESTVLEHSADSGKTFRTLATLKSANDVAWSSSDAFDIATLRAAANRSELYVVRLAGRQVNGAGVRICEWWHDVRRATVTVHVDGASGVAYHVDAHVARAGTDVPLSCADAALLPAASAARQPAVRVDFGRTERAPKVAEFRRAVAKQRAESQDNRPWYIKYWYYIVPAVILFLISSATGGGGGAAAAGEQQQTSHQ